ncbi:hypothetical protein CCM_05762 [Cordyceps militaris CM01]|uniref:SRP9 domain-containing protein n=1 Tax=Cordyceps militaris (strain CM01) TaxID=983644 RepID=G3JH48_CORMM|nr:uncharacterized protein CCM_05762 [Cordyceps militaris CM01]EGX91604.1 hypothetical protein CCM_05762 [Cordyceps militaris CM01]
MPWRSCPTNFFIYPISPPSPAKPLNLAYTFTPALPHLELNCTIPSTGYAPYSLLHRYTARDSQFPAALRRYTDCARASTGPTRPQNSVYRPRNPHRNSTTLVMSYFKTGQEWLDQSALLIQASPTTTKITTRYSIKVVKRRKPAVADTAAAAEKPPRAVLVLKTFDPCSGVTLKYRTTKAAEVSRLMGAAMGQLGRSMAALPDVSAEEPMPDAAVDEEVQKPQPAAPAPAPQAQSAPATGGGGKKKKKGKK